MSFWRKWSVVSKDVLSNEEVAERLQKAEKALELKYLDRPQSEITSEQVAAAAQLIKALDTVHEAAAQIGSLLVLKRTDSDGRSYIATRTLTYKEMRLLEMHPDLLRQPSLLLNALESTSSQAVSSEEDTP